MFHETDKEGPLTGRYWPVLAGTAFPKKQKRRMKQNAKSWKGRIADEENTLKRPASAHEILQNKNLETSLLHEGSTKKKAALGLFSVP